MELTIGSCPFADRIGLPCASSGQILHQSLGTWSDTKQAAQYVWAQQKKFHSALYREWYTYLDWGLPVSCQ